MKKLMTVLASAATALCAVGAWADFTETSTDFEGLTAGQAFDSNNGMNGYWVGASDAELFISNHTDTISVSRPNYEDRDNANEKYLAIESSVTRGLNEMSGTAFPGVAIPDNGIYLDTLVKFTAADEVFGNDALAAGDKIAIEYVAQGDDVDDPITNFVIRAGYIGTEVTAKNYFAAVPENFDVSAWHRLTVRTFASIDAANHVGFVVYLDEVPLAYSTSDACGDNFEATGLAADYYTNELRALYPSAVGVGDDKSTIASVTFSGTGCIDDVVFSTEPRDFITVNPDVTVTWDESVATLTLNGAPVEGFVACTEGSAKITPVEGVVTVVATFADGYVYGACDTDGAGAWDASTKQFTNLTPGETCSIYGMLPTFKVGADQYFDNFEDALVAAVDAGTAQNPATIQLMADCDSALAFSEGNIILDLAGYDIQGGADADYSLVNAGANLTIINTGDEASIKTPLSGATIAMYHVAAGFTTVEAGTFEGTIYFYAGEDVEDVFAKDYLLLKGGKFIDPDYATESTFYLATCVQSGLSTTYDSETGYVQVGDVPPTPSSGYDSGDGTHTFTIDSTTEAALVTNLPTGKTLASAVSETSSMTYAQAYALGLWDDEADEVADLDATISVGADGKVTVSLANAPATGYLVTCKVYEKASLTDEWPSEPKTTYAYGSEQTITPASSTAGFYKVEVVISNSLQQ